MVDGSFGNDGEGLDTVLGRMTFCICNLGLINMLLVSI